MKYIRRVFTLSWWEKLFRSFSSFRDLSLLEGEKRPKIVKKSESFSSSLSVDKPIVG